MPYYNKTAIPPRGFLLTPGSATFLFGSKAATGGTMIVNSVSITGNVATVGVTSWEGNLPAVGTLISINGTSSGAGEFNVTGGPVTSVTLDQNGTGTVSFALTGANLATTPDAGKLTFNPQIIGEAIAAGASMPGSPAFNQGRAVNSFAAEVYFSTIPTAATVALQGAMTNDDTAFITLATVATVSGSAVTVMGNPLIQTDFPFLRFLISGLTGTGVIAAALTY